MVWFGVWEMEFGVQDFGLGGFVDRGLGPGLGDWDWFFVFVFGVSGSYVLLVGRMIDMSRVL